MLEVTEKIYLHKKSLFQQLRMRRGLPWWLRCQRICLQGRRSRFRHWVRKIPWGKAWQPTPVFLLGEFHRQKSSAGYSPWVLEESFTSHTEEGRGGRREMIGEKEETKLDISSKPSRGHADPWLLPQAAPCYCLASWSPPFQWVNSILVYAGEEKSPFRSILEVVIFNFVPLMGVFNISCHQGLELFLEIYQICTYELKIGETYVKDGSRTHPG